MNDTEQRTLGQSANFLAALDQASQLAPLDKPVLTNKRFDLIIDDGMNYVAKTDRRFDIIIVDSTDPLGPGKVLFSEKFYAACKRCMAKGGLLITQNGVPIFQAGELTATISRFRKLFADGYC